jgi:hypothetical protein
LPIEVAEFQSESMFSPFLPIKTPFSGTRTYKYRSKWAFLPMNLKISLLEINKIMKLKRLFATKGLFCG